MSESFSNWKYRPLAYALVILAWLAYAALTWLAPTTANARYHITPLELDLLRLTIMLPTVIIWLIATSGAVAFKSYARMITGAPESSGLNLVADGLLFLVAWQVMSSLMSSLEGISVGSRAYDLIVILHDHIPPYLTLIGFLLIYVGSHRMKAVAKFTTWTTITFWVMAAFALFVIAFVLEFTHATTMTGAGAPITSTSLISSNVLLFSLILPHLLSWFFGILAAINIYKFSRSVKGVIYRSALNWLVRGTATVIAFASIDQVITFSDRFIATLNLATILAVLYAFIFIYALGFVFIWMGAKQLKRLEALE